MRLGRHVSALAATTCGLLGGVWLALSPWAFGLLRAGAPWGTQAVTESATGAGLVLIAALSYLIYGRSLSALLADAGDMADPEPTTAALPQRRGRRRPKRAAPDSPRPSPRHADGRAAAPVASRAAAAPAPPGATPAPGSGGATEALDVLLPIATALLSDIAAQQGRPAAGPGRGADVR